MNDQNENRLCNIPNEDRRKAIQLLKQVALECRIAIAKIESGTKLLELGQFVQVITIVQQDLFGINCQLPPLYSEREFFSDNCDNSKEQSYLNSFWGSD